MNTGGIISKELVFRDDAPSTKCAVYIPMSQCYENNGYLFSISHMGKTEHPIDFEICVSPIQSAHNHENYGIRDWTVKSSIHVYSVPIHDTFMFDTNTHVVKCKIDVPSDGENWISNIEIYNK